MKPIDLSTAASVEVDHGGRRLLFKVPREGGGEAVVALPLAGLAKFLGFTLRLAAQIDDGSTIETAPGHTEGRLVSLPASELDLTGADDPMASFLSLRVGAVDIQAALQPKAVEVLRQLLR